MASPEMEGGGGSGRKYKGVRRRKWGKWVTEIRLPNSRERVWLGSYDAPEKAARSFDAAFVCLRGSGAAVSDLNFPDSPPPCRARSRDPQEVQAAALSHANREPVTAQEAAAALVMDVDYSPPAPTALLSENCSVTHGMDDDVLGGGGGSGSEGTAPATICADGSFDWRPVMAHPPPLFSPTGCTNAYDFLHAPPPLPQGDDDDMDDGSHGGATACLWNFDSMDSCFRY